jgi:hypothetical protein
MPSIYVDEKKAIDAGWAGISKQGDGLMHGKPWIAWSFAIVMLPFCGCIFNSKDTSAPGPFGFLTDGYWVGRDSTWNPNCLIEMKFHANGHFDMREAECSPPDFSMLYSQTVGSYRVTPDSIHFSADSSAERKANLFHFEWSFTCLRWDFTWSYQKAGGNPDSIHTALDGGPSLTFIRKPMSEFSIYNSLDPVANFINPKIQISPAMRALCPKDRQALAKENGCAASPEADCSGPTFEDFDILYSIYDDKGDFRFADKAILSPNGPVGLSDVVWPFMDANGNPMGPGYYFVQAVSKATGEVETRCLYRQ